MKNNIYLPTGFVISASYQRLLAKAEHLLSPVGIKLGDKN